MNLNHFFRVSFLVIVFGITPLFLFASDSDSTKNSAMKDTLDGKLDMSNMLVNMNGFMPVPIILSEPALGNFCVAMAAVFITPQKDTTNKDRFHFPTMNIGLGMYTLNNSWAAGFMRMASIPKCGLR